MYSYGSILLFSKILSHKKCEFGGCIIMSE
jgi:hypothetical protein